MKSKLSFLFIALAMLQLGCTRRQAMYDQPRYEPWEPSDFFKDGRASRQPVPGTVARGKLRDDELMYSGTVEGKSANIFPSAVTRETIERGAARYQIHCTPCHGMVGDGNGMIVQRGFYRPPSYHIDRLVAAPVGYFYNVISQGIGNMSGYAAYIQPADRWAIIAYIRALQASQSASIADLQSVDRAKLEAMK